MQTGRTMTPCSTMSLMRVTKGTDRKVLPLWTNLVGPRVDHITNTPFWPFQHPRPYITKYSKTILLPT